MPKKITNSTVEKYVAKEPEEFMDELRKALKRA